MKWSIDGWKSAWKIMLDADSAGRSIPHPTTTQLSEVSFSFFHSEKCDFERPRSCLCWCKYFFPSYCIFQIMAVPAQMATKATKKNYHRKGWRRWINFNKSAPQIISRLIFAVLNTACFSHMFLTNCPQCNSLTCFLSIPLNFQSDFDV